MSSPTVSNFVSALFNEVDTLLNQYIYNGYHALANDLAPTLAVAATLYIVFLGISVTQGWVKLSMSNVVKSAVTVAVIYMLAMNWDFFSEYIVNGVQGAAAHLGDVLLQASPVPMPQNAGSGVHGAIQSTLDQYVNLSQILMSHVHLRNWQPALGGIFVFFFGYLLVGFALFEMIVAQIMLALMLTIAPIMVPLALFKPTRGITDRWQGAIVGFALLMIFLSATLALVTSLTYWVMMDMSSSQGTMINGFADWATVILISLIGIGLVMKVSQLAMSIGGTVASTSGAALVAVGAAAVGSAASTIDKIPGVKAGRTALQEKAASTLKNSVSSTIQYARNKIKSGNAS